MLRSACVHPAHLAERVDFGELPLLLSVSHSLDVIKAVPTVSSHLGDTVVVEGWVHLRDGSTEEAGIASHVVSGVHCVVGKTESRPDFQPGHDQAHCKLQAELERAYFQLPVFQSILLWISQACKSLDVHPRCVQQKSPDQHLPLTGFRFRRVRSEIIHFFKYNNNNNSTVMLISHSDTTETIINRNKTNKLSLVNLNQRD